MGSSKRPASLPAKPENRERDRREGEGREEPVPVARLNRQEGERRED
jgi:hypothetical protein